MKTYTIQNPGSVPQEGLPVTEDGFLELGESGRGRNLSKIPVIGDGLFAKVGKTKEGIIIALSEKNDDDNRLLAIINTVGQYDRHRSYGLFDDSGVADIESGSVAFGQAGRINGGEVILAILAPFAEFRLNSKYTSHWYRIVNGEIVMESVAGRKARKSIEAIKADPHGVEWL